VLFTGQEFGGVSARNEADGKSGVDSGSGPALQHLET
jgi:hypothetical protein